MATEIYVGNLPSSATVEQLHTLFSAYGHVEAIELMADRATGHLHGFGFVALASGATTAIAAFHGTVLEGSRLAVRLPRVGRRAQRPHPR
jgi:RNA recognition motif-containing protein